MIKGDSLAINHMVKGDFPQTEDFIKLDDYIGCSVLAFYRRVCCMTTSAIRDVCWGGHPIGATCAQGPSW